MTMACGAEEIEKDTSNFMEVPVKALHSSYYIKVKRRNLLVSIEDKAIDVFFLETAPKTISSSENQKLPSVLLLHGSDDTSQIWEDIGTLTLLAALGYRALAIDLPEFGLTRGSGVKDTARFVELFLAGANVTTPVILVSACFGGHYAIPYILENSRNIAQKVRAFIPIAPTNSHNFLSENRSNYIRIPIFAVYGSLDEKQGGSASRNMGTVFSKNQVTYMIGGAGKRCFVNETDDWHYLLYNILRQLKATF